MPRPKLCPRDPEDQSLVKLMEHPKRQLVKPVIHGNPLHRTSNSADIYTILLGDPVFFFRTVASAHSPLLAPSILHAASAAIAELKGTS